MEKAAHTLRSATPSDADTLVRLWTSTFNDAYHDLHSPQDINSYCAANYTLAHATGVLTDGEHECVIAGSGDRSTGLLVIKWAPCPVDMDGPSAELKQIYISASAYGTGLGKMLFEKAIAMLVDKNIQWMWLTVSDSNPRAKAFYEKNGFSHYGAGPDLHVGKDVLASSILVRRVK
ncbi:GNAT family N-acetyltransferase [Marinicaulis aureus]|uniref:GNAT family N-acetyltransferase n=1 Tax=Hyphococcus aureus TaxID=2666033 RepID=A0ABW1KX36_9PROT